MSVDRREQAGNLPAASSGFVGRDTELEQISVLLLGSARLITLIGSGGIGKTRLATEVVHRLRKARHTPVYWVRLARLAAGADVASVEVEVARSVVDADFSGRSAWDELVDKLTSTDAVGHDLPVVVVMDNCEHVLAPVGELCAELLDAVPGLTILATSREALGWVDERLVTVPPLTNQQALTLFRARAELANHPLTNAEEVAAANEICGHVHNHPLYIRLAAARLLRQPLGGILSELSGASTDRRLRWSHGPSVGAESRHRGVSDVIAWSYDLCTEKEQLLLDRMSVFAAGYDTNPADAGGSALDVGADLEAIETVCADDDSSRRNDGPTLAAAEIEGLLDRLVDQSLVTAHLTPTTVRYSLLESLRVFAQQRLQGRSTTGVDEPARLAKRHREYYRTKVILAQFSWYGPGEQVLVDWARAAWDNILLAIETSISTPGESTIGLEISVGLIAMRALIFRGSLREMRQWIERTLAGTRELDPQPVDLQLGAMAMIGWIALCQGEHEDAARILEDCVQICVRDPEVRRTWRQTVPDLPAPVAFVWGAELMLVHRDPRAIAVLARSRERFHRLGLRGGEAMCEQWEALAAGFLGSSEQALEVARRHLDHATESGARWAKSWAELTWALALTKHGDATEAMAVGRSALEYQVAARDQWGAVLAVQFRAWSLARLVADSAETDRAELEAQATEIAQLVGGARALRAALGVDIEEMGPFADETTKAIDIARSVLDEDGFEAAERQGSLLRIDADEVQRLALGTLSLNRVSVDHPAREAMPSHWDELSTAEQEVAMLAAAGWTNTAIAARRGNSVRTVDAQMSAIFQKLMISSRDQVIKLVPDDQMDTVRAEAERRPSRRRRADPRSRW